MLIVLFGLPATGKNYIGDILSKEYSFFYYDADDDLTREIKKIINQERIMPNDLRTEYFNKIIKNVKQCQKKHLNLAVSQAFVKEEHRELFLKNFPEAIFLLVDAKKLIRNKRLDNRKHLIKRNYAKKIEDIFERPLIKHFIIDNSNGKSEIKNQLNIIINNKKYAEKNRKSFG